jgi:hypothetical protein
MSLHGKIKPKRVRDSFPLKLRQLASRRMLVPVLSLSFTQQALSRGVLGVELPMAKSRQGVGSLQYVDESTKSVFRLLVWQ